MSQTGLAGVARSFCAVLLASPAAIAGQNQPTTPWQRWHLASPRLEFGLASESLHRVAGAVLGDDGSLAIADGGNHRIVLVSGDGDLIRVLGRRGGGPGEFDYLANIFDGGGDTLVTFDAGKGQVAFRALASGETTAFRLPVLEDQTPWVDGAVNGSTLLLRTAEFKGSGRDGLYVSDSRIRLFRPLSNSLSIVERRPGRYHYLVTEEFGGGQRGRTTYAPPFLGKALFAAAGEYYAVVPLDSATVEVSTLPTVAARRVPLPIPAWSLSSEVVGRTRDSLLARNRVSRYGSREARDRISRVYGEDFPLPARGPAVRRLLAIGDHFWVEPYGQASSEHTQWFVVDPAAATVVAEVNVPGGERILGGNEHSVVLLARTTMDVEFVRVRELKR